MRPEFTSILFEEPAKAVGNLERVEQQLAPTLLAPLASLLSQSPDPDGALNLLERYVYGAPPRVLGDIAHYPTALSYLVAIFSYSGYLAETLLSEPELVVQFALDRNFTKLKSQEDLMQDYARFSTTQPDPWLAASLARFKRRNYLRLVLKDVLRLSTLGETTLELSILADVILTNAWHYCDRELAKRYGQPEYRDAQGRIARAGFSIVSLGKLGGNELNYNSDIDLLFLYSHDGETSGGNERESVITNKEYFVHLARAITRTITQPTSQGQVFRIDLRLRPEGDQGDLAISLRSAREYYEHRARDWELQMLIKARHSAGEAKLTRDFLRSVEDYVYRSPGDFVAVESILLARERISKKLRESRGHAIDVKHHRGGIRDIEFLVQCLQRLHGRQDHWVRSGGTLFALRKLNDKGWLSDRDYAALTADYDFLRKVEHRVQMDAGQQTHRLPSDAQALERLARRTGVEPAAGERPSDALLRRVRQAFTRVDDIYQRVIHHPADPSVLGTAFELTPAPTLLADSGRQPFDSLVSYLAVQAPEVAGLVREANLTERARRNATRLLAAMVSSSERFTPVREKPEVLRRALEVASTSDYLTDLLVHHPEDLAMLDPTRSAPPDPAAEQLEIGIALPVVSEPFPWAAAPELDLREKMALLRREFRARVLALGAADIADGGSASAMLKRWSANAARCIASALVVAMGAVNHDPRPESSAEMPFVVLAMGRLGLSEFDLASDADLIFVTACETAREELEYWTRVTERTLEVLSSYTRDGTLFAVDTRLRPRGQEGELVVSADALLSYLAENAQAWELLTYLKANPVAGNPRLGQELTKHISQTIFDRMGAFGDFEGELHQMRRRLERKGPTSEGAFKTAPGGYYDVDFAVSYLRLRARLEAPLGANMVEQISELQTRGLIATPDAEALRAGAGLLRSLDHALRLVTGKAPGGLPEHPGHAEAAEAITHRWELLPDGRTLAEELRETQRQLRYVYRRLVESE